jgi:chloramphenicol O-acetyltransferase type A
MTLLDIEDLFAICTFAHKEDFCPFEARAAEEVAHVRERGTLEEEAGRDDLLFMTSIPWVSFTSFMYTLDLHPADSVPLFAWGKFFEDGKCLKMPLSVQGHHALMDGVHMGRFYEKIQSYL